ncbi:MAG TPA: hypothetical protein VD969_05950 [Symbiobacteriaceae bacterium]|nr:hypothetical protein [Symbiobacteriaceae bacterium]
MIRHRRPHDNHEGYILITTLISLAVVALLGTAALGWALTGLRLSRQAVESEQAFYMANAGIEQSLAKLLTFETLTNFSETLPIAGGLTGSYSVAIATNPDASLDVTSTGQVGDTTRVVTARMVPGTPGGGGPGGGGPGGEEPVPPPPGIPEQIYQQAIYSNGSLAFNNNSVICGDMYSVGSIILDNNSRVVGTVGSPCASIAGTGKLEATGMVSLGNNSTVAGGWCDSAHWGSPPEHPCPAAPSFTPMLPPDLDSQATQTHAGSLILSGTQTYEDDIVRITGDLSIAKKGVAVSGNVTFVVGGRVEVEGDLTCSGACTVAIVAEGDIGSSNNLEIWSTLVTGNRLSLGNQVTVHGNLQGDSFDVLNGVILYPLAVSTGSGSTPTGPALTGWHS